MLSTKAVGRATATDGIFHCGNINPITGTAIAAQTAAVQIRWRDAADDLRHAALIAPATARITKLLRAASPSSVTTRSQMIGVITCPLPWLLLRACLVGRAHRQKGCVRTYRAARQQPEWPSRRRKCGSSASTPI